MHYMLFETHQQTFAGRDRVYRVNVPMAQTLTATVTPTTLLDPAIYLVGAPAAMCDASPIVCLDGDDDAGDGAPETVTFTNTGAATDVFIVIDSFYAADEVPYTLAVTIAP